MANEKKAKKTEQAPAKKQAPATEKGVVKLSADKLKTALEHAEIAHPHAEFIYINALGQYHLHPRPGFAKVATNSAAAVDDEPEELEPVKNEKPVDPGLPAELPTGKQNDGLEF